MKRIIASLLKENIAVTESILHKETSRIEEAARLIISAIRKGKKLLVFGNGGSAADSQHIAAELVGRFKKERSPLAAIALTTNTSTLTAIGNDYGFDSVFSRQIEALAQPGDVALAISTSGNSRNAIEALKTAKKKGITTIGMLGGRGGKMKALCDIIITVPSINTPRIQESHITIGHILCELIESRVCGKKR